MRTSDFTAERGSAALEFVVLGLLAHVTIVAIALPALQQQRVQLAANGLASEVARAVSQESLPTTSLSELVQLQVQNYDLDPNAGVSVEVNPNDPAPGQLFTVRIRIGAVETTDRQRMPR